MQHDNFFLTSDSSIFLINKHPSAVEDDNVVASMGGPVLTWCIRWCKCACSGRVCQYLFVEDALKNVHRITSGNPPQFVDTRGATPQTVPDQQTHPEDEMS